MPLLKPFFRLPGSGRGRWTLRRARRVRMLAQLSILAICLSILLPAYTIYKPPRLLIQYFQNRFPEVLFQIATTRKVVALTIDDAPSSHTRDILSILEENGATATFFVIGNQVPGNEDILVDIIRSGSELGNHAMHDEPSISLPSSELSSQIQTVDTLINAAYSSAGVSRPPQTNFFRPGSGVFSRRILKIASEAGYKTILGSIYPHDPFISYWSVNAWHILTSLRPGAVIICHDRRSWTVPMLKKAVPEMRRRGYEVVNISKFLEMEKG